MAEPNAGIENEYVASARLQLASDQSITLETAPLGAVLIALSEGLISASRSGVDPVSLDAGSYLYWPAGEPVAIRNLGSASLEFVTARVKQLTAMDAPAASLGEVPLHKLQFEDDRVEIYRVTFEPGATTGMHYHPRKGFAVITRGGALRTTLPDGDVSTNQLTAGNMFWHEEEVRHHLENVGETTLQVVDVEWK